MKAIASIAIEPIGGSVSLSKYIATVRDVLEAYGLQPRVHSTETTVEGDLARVTEALVDCHKIVHELEVPRIVSHIKIETRTDREQSRSDLTRSVSTREKDISSLEDRQAQKKENQELDEALKDTFPASDPVTNY